MKGYDKLNLLMMGFPWRELIINVTPPKINKHLEKKLKRFASLNSSGSLVACTSFPALMVLLRGVIGG